MVRLAGWITGEQVPEDIIREALEAMGTVLGRHGTEPTYSITPGAGLLTCVDPAYAAPQRHEPPLLDWVPEHRTLTYRRPLNGQHVLYFLQDWPAQGNLVFASEIKALLALNPPRRLNLAALAALQHYGFLPAPLTAFRDIQVVPAGALLRWQRGKVVLNRTSDLLPKELAEVPLEELYDQLQQATTEYLSPELLPVGLGSGGSASTLAIALAAHLRPFTVASIGWKKHGPEWQIAEQVAEACGLPWLAVGRVDHPDYWAATIASLESPCVDDTALTLHQLLHTAAVETQARIALSGLGARLLLGEPKRPTKSNGTHSENLFSYYKKQLGMTTGSLWTQDATRMLEAETAWEETLYARKLERAAGKLDDPTAYLELHMRLPDQVVTPAQHLASQEQMALRSPYLHPHVMPLLVQLSQKTQAYTQRDHPFAHLVRKHVAKGLEARSSLSLHGPVTTPENLELVYDLIGPAALRQTGLFDPEALKAILKRPQTEEHRRKLLLVFTTQLFLRIFHVSI
uniref:asparagine synthase (glutamine-hydrolyzing) n=1 Tax=Thermosporothrix sp. COM3 TaxID=2490863 RepID=A0A455STU6_9CHLR|nr:hypothetical protein KTC_33250 [Thermosporothrix sp. COM3]